jgi:hypothetical protein
MTARAIRTLVDGRAAEDLGPTLAEAFGESHEGGTVVVLYRSACGWARAWVRCSIDPEHPAPVLEPLRAPCRQAQVEIDADCQQLPRSIPREGGHVLGRAEVQPDRVCRPNLGLLQEPTSVRACLGVIPVAPRPLCWPCIPATRCPRRMPSQASPPDQGYPSSVTRLMGSTAGGAHASFEEFSVVTCRSREVCERMHDDA